MGGVLDGPANGAKMCASVWPCPQFSDMDAPNPAGGTRRHAEARGHVQALARCAHDENLQCSAHPFGEPAGAGEVGIRERDAELLAAVTKQDVAVADTLEHAVRDGLQGDVAGGMPVLVVDGLESIDVDHDERQRCAVTVRELHLAVEHLAEAHAVVHSRKRIPYRSV